jgi:hypothetical protein
MRYLSAPLSLSTHKMHKKMMKKSLPFCVFRFPVRLSAFAIYHVVAVVVHSASRRIVVDQQPHIFNASETSALNVSS